MRDYQADAEFSVGRMQDTAPATSKEVTPEQQTIVDFRMMLKDTYVAFNHGLRERAEAIEDPQVRTQVLRRVDTLIAETDRVRERVDGRLRADAKKFSAQGEAFLKGRYDTIQRGIVPLMARAKTAIARVSDSEKTLQGEDSFLVLRLESCSQQAHAIQTIMRQIEQDISATGPTLDTQNTQQLSQYVAAFEKKFLFLTKEIAKLEKTLDEFFSDTQNLKEKALNKERQDLDDRIKIIILEITHLKEESGDIGESVAKQRTADRTNLYGQLKMKVQELEKRIEPLEELTAHTLDDATSHKVDLLADDNQNRSAFFEETQAVLDEAVDLFERLAESFKFSEETTTTHEEKESNEKMTNRRKKEALWGKIKKFFHKEIP